MFYKHQNKPNDFISVYNTEGCILKCERGSGFSVHFYLVTFWWWLWTTGVKCSHPNALPEQRVVCGTDRGHLVLLCQLLQLVGFVLRFYESLLHIFHCLDRQGAGWMEGWGGMKRYNTICHCTKNPLKTFSKIVCFKFSEVQAARNADVLTCPEIISMSHGWTLACLKRFRWWPLLVFRRPIGCSYCYGYF